MESRQVNGKAFIGILATALAVIGLFVGWGVAYGMIVKDVDKGIEGHRIATQNCNRLTALETRLECLPDMNRKLDSLLIFAAKKGKDE